MKKSILKYTIDDLVEELRCKVNESNISLVVAEYKVDEILVREILERPSVLTYEMYKILEIILEKDIDELTKTLEFSEEKNFRADKLTNEIIKTVDMAESIFKEIIANYKLNNSGNRKEVEQSNKKEVEKSNKKEVEKPNEQRSLTKEEKERIEKIAIKVKEYFRNTLKINDLRDPFEVLSNLEKLIIIRFSGDKEIQGYSQKLDQYRCIYINSNDPLGRQYYSLWHEYYHAIDNLNMVGVSFKGDGTLVEKKAEYFACCMLMGKDDIKNYVTLNYENIYNIQEDGLIKMQQDFRVSFKSLVVRLAEIYNYQKLYKFNLGSLDRVEEFHKKIRMLGYDLDLVIPTNDFCIPQRFFAILEKNIIANKITLDKANNLLNFFDEKGCITKW